MCTPVYRDTSFSSICRLDMQSPACIGTAATVAIFGWLGGRQSPFPVIPFLYLYAFVLPFQRFCFAPFLVQYLYMCTCGCFPVDMFSLPLFCEVCGAQQSYVQFLHPVFFLVWSASAGGFHHLCFAFTLFLSPSVECRCCTAGCRKAE